MHVIGESAPSRKKKEYLNISWHSSIINVLIKIILQTVKNKNISIFTGKSYTVSFYNYTANVEITFLQKGSLSLISVTLGDYKLPGASTFHKTRHHVASSTTGFMFFFSLGVCWHLVDYRWYNSFNFILHNQIFGLHLNQPWGQTVQIC